jgi:hypothetical protein
MVPPNNLLISAIGMLLFLVYILFGLYLSVLLENGSN